MKILQTLVEDDAKKKDLIERMAVWYEQYGNNWQGYTSDVIRMAAKVENSWLFSKVNGEYEYGYSVKFDNMKAVKAFPEEIKYVSSIVVDHLNDLSWLQHTGRLALTCPGLKLEQFKHIKLYEKCTLEMRCESITSFKGIHKIMNTPVKKIWINPFVRDSILGVLMLPEIEEVVVSSSASYALQEAVKAIRPFIGKGKTGVLEAQEAMMERDILEPFAEL